MTTHAGGWADGADCRRRAVLVRAVSAEPAARSARLNEGTVSSRYSATAASNSGCLSNSAPQTGEPAGVPAGNPASWVRRCDSAVVQCKDGAAVGEIVALPPLGDQVLVAARLMASYGSVHTAPDP